MDVRVAWAEFDTNGSAPDVRVSWCEFDTNSPVEEIVIPIGGGEEPWYMPAYHERRTGRYEIQLAGLAADDEEAIILSVVLAVAQLEML